MRFTPFEVPAIMMYAQTTKSTGPSAMPVSRMNETSVDAGVKSVGKSGKFMARIAKATATTIWPPSLAQARRPRLRCLATLM